LSRPAALIALATGVAANVAVLGGLAAWTIGAILVAVALVGLLSWRKIGGVTGDALGAAEQVAETAVLVCGAAFVQHAAPWPWWR
jgi:adenosylcobinamide-GDP ribazoletransferase